MGPWFLSEGVAGTGDRPDWYKADKFKSVADQAAALPGLEAKLGPAAELIGAPKGDYKLPDPPKGTSGKWDPEDPLLKRFLPLAKELNLSEAAVAKIISPMAELIAQQNAADDQALADALTGLGPNANARIAAVDNYLVQTVGQEGWDALRLALGKNVAAYKALELVVGKASGDAQLAGGEGHGGAGFTKADADAARYEKYPADHKLAGKIKYEHDAQHRATVDGMYKKLFPGADQQEVH